MLEFATRRYFAGSGMVSDPSFPSDWSTTMRDVRDYDKEMKRAENLMDSALLIIAVSIVALVCDMIRVCCF